MAHRFGRTPLVALLALLAGLASPAAAQFGKNKVQYKDFHWNVIETEHFDVYYYDGEEECAFRSARMAERAYVRLSRILVHEIERAVPVVIYASHSDFEQTNITTGLIPEGVGGITEFQKGRVFLPFTGSYRELDHVLTHELVHAFQMDVLYGGAIEANPFAFQPPLWFMEGMAEYLSLGGVDPHTEMWLRWTALEGALIPLQYMDQIYDIRVYRIGQAIFAFLGEQYGDEKIGEFLRRTVLHRSVPLAAEKTFGLSFEALSREWEDYVKRKYYPQIVELGRPEDFARRLSRGEEHDAVHLAPALSPDGDLLAYIEDNRFSKDIVLASGIDGKKLRRLVEGGRSSDFESLRYFHTSLGWSPDGSLIAFPSKRGAEDVLNLFDLNENRVVRTLSFRLDALYSPSFHPDGRRIVFSGVRSGQSDLYVVDLATEKLTQLTQDPYLARDPQYSPDGERIAYVTDRGPDTDLEKLIFGEPRIAILDVGTGETTLLPGQRGKNITPQWGPDGRTIAFVSDRFGVSDLFVQDVVSGRLYRVTELLTGVSGIIESSPALTWSRDGRRIVFSAFHGVGWGLYQIENPLEKMDEIEQTETLEQLAARERESLDLWDRADLADEVRLAAGRVRAKDEAVEPAAESTEDDEGESFRKLGGLLAPGPTDLSIAGPASVGSAAFLRPGERPGFARGPEDRPFTLSSLRAETADSLPAPETLDSKPYKLRWSPDFVAASPVFASNVGFAGQAQISISDMLGNHIFEVGVSVYGSLSDSDLLLSYYNLAKRTNWGVSVFQFRNDFGIFTARDRVEFESQIYRGTQAFVSRPFSKFSRFEFHARGIGVSRKVFSQSFVAPGIVDTDEGDSDLVYYGGPGIALVTDNVVYSYYGPLSGTRSRLSVDQAFGDVQFTTGIGDYRHYIALGRSGATFATRLIAGTSFGNTPQVFRIGGSQTLRGVDYGDLEGSNIGLLNLELRFPLIEALRIGWPLRIGLGGINGAFFLDAGGTWNRVPRVFRDGALDDVTAGYGFGLRLGLGYFALKYDVAQRTDFRRRIGDSQSYFTIGVDF
jgi:Tol biopolymer transport system component